MHWDYTFVDVDGIEQSLGSPSLRYPWINSLAEIDPPEPHTRRMQLVAVEAQLARFLVHHAQSQ